MRQYYIMHMEHAGEKGIRIHKNLYDAILTTVDKYSKEKFPFLKKPLEIEEELEIRKKRKFRRVGDDEIIKVIIERDELKEFKKELEDAGKIVLANNLITTYDINGKLEVVLEPTFTKHQAAVYLATTIDLCKLCSSEKRDLVIIEKDLRPWQNDLEFYVLARKREDSWFFPPKAKTLKNHIEHKV